MTKQLAIMKNVGIGMRDCHSPVLWFSAFISEGSAALQVLNWDRAKDLIAKSGVYSVLELEGKSCWVNVGDNMIKFLELAKI